VDDNTAREHVPRENQSVPISQANQEPIGPLDLVAVESPRVLQVSQIFRRFDVPNPPPENLDGLGRERTGPLVARIQPLQRQVGEDELQSICPAKTNIACCVPAFTHGAYVMMQTGGGVLLFVRLSASRWMRMQVGYQGKC